MKTIATSLLSRIELNDGHTMPMFGLGLYLLKGQDCVRAVSSALKAGYRMLDAAEYYENEKYISEGIKCAGVPRDEIFITSKIWNNHKGYESCRRVVENVLKRMGTTYLDLFLIHSPLEGKNVETYRAMLDMQKEGKIRSVGVSNFSVEHLEGLKREGLPIPAVNQIELNPWMRQTSLVEYCRKQGIVLEAFAPLAKMSEGKCDNPTLVKIAETHHKTPVDVLIRWGVQNGFVMIPKSSNPERIKANAHAFEFALTDDEMDTLESFPESPVSWLFLKKGQHFSSWYPTCTPWVA